MAYNCLDRHDPNLIAFTTDSAVTGKTEIITFGDLTKRVARFAKVLQNNGVKTGDSVVIYMPMIIEIVVAMLACARIGAVHNVVFGGFASKELASRISHSGANVLVTAAGSKELERTVDYLSIIDQIGSVKDKTTTVISVDRDGIGQKAESMGFLSYQNEMDKAPSDLADCVWVDSDHPLYILYTSGTTGTPKGVVCSTAGYAVALNWSHSKIWGIAKPEDNWFCAADIGWVVGHSYTVYAPLLTGTPSLIYEGKPVTPNDGHSPFFRLLSEHKIKRCFASPTAMRAIRNTASARNDRDCVEVRQKFDISRLETMFIAGEHCEIDTLKWSRQAFECDTFDNWWQTEVGWPLTAPHLGIGDDFAVSQPDGSTGLPVPGWNVQVVGNDEIAIKLPLPPGAFSTLWKADDRFREHYFSKFPGFYDSMDSGKIDENGFVTIINRTDDVINVAGHRISTGSVEECLCNERGLLEAAVVGKKDTIKGAVPVAFLIAENEECIEKALKRVEKEIGRFSKIHKFYWVKRLPKTRSGKTPRKTLKALVDGEDDLKIPSTIEDMSVYDELREILRESDKQLKKRT